MEWAVAAVLFGVGVLAIVAIGLGRSQGIAPHNPFGPFGFRGYVRKTRDDPDDDAHDQRPAGDGAGQKKP